MLLSLIKLSESDKRAIFVVLILVIVVILLVWYLGLIIKKTMKYQGKKIDRYVYDVVVYKVVTEPSDFKRYAKKKNWQIFYMRSRWPVLILLAAVVGIIIIDISAGRLVNPFDATDGFGTLLFLWDFSVVFSLPKEGAGIIVQWPKLVNTPHFVLENWACYLVAVAIIFAGVWYLWNVQSFLARFLRIRKLADSIYSKDLDGYNQFRDINGFDNSKINPMNPNPVNPLSQPQNNPQENSNRDIFFK